MISAIYIGILRLKSSTSLILIKEYQKIGILRTSRKAITEMVAKQYTSSLTLSTVLLNSSQLIASICSTSSTIKLLEAGLVNKGIMKGLKTIKCHCRQRLTRRRKLRSSHHQLIDLVFPKRQQPWVIGPNNKTSTP